jgi:CHAT domain-containing protein
MDDFRQAREVLAAMKADVVPADQDRVALEAGLSEMFDGLVEAGNRLAASSGDRSLLSETFEAAEQNRVWSLRALIPGANDWRTKLPDRYWETLSRYQNLEREAISKPNPDLERRALALRNELREMEAAAAGPREGHAPSSSLAHLQRVLDADTAVFSFHVSKRSSWAWVVDRSGIQAYPLPPIAMLESRVAELNKSLRAGSFSAGIAAALYSDIFGAAPQAAKARKSWLLEPDGPLYELPFGALVSGKSESAIPRYLIEETRLQTLPSALLASRESIPLNGEFLGIGDPVYNQADQRYTGTRSNQSLLLARLPNTGDEIQACAGAWRTPNARLLTGAGARIDDLRTALERRPAVVHFATHVIAEPGDHRSGLIALSLNATGEMGLLGPKEIVARPVHSSLIVMDGCHSAQGESLPSAGLMGLTRAWIGAGAMSVVATQWDIPDDTAQGLMTDFYRELRADPRHGVASALRNAQLSALRRPDGRKKPESWAGYFLLSRAI